MSESDPQASSIPAATNGPRHPRRRLVLALTVGALLVGGCALAVRMGWMSPFRPGSSHESWAVTGALLLPVGTPEGNGEILVAARQNTRNSLALISLKDGTTLWEKDVPATPQAAGIDGLAADDGLVFALSGNRLRAFQRDTGALAWEATASAGMDPLCDRCLRVRKGRIILWTAAGMLQAFDARSGKPSWTRRSAGLRQMQELGGDLILLDAYEGNGFVSIVDASTGQNRRQIFPVCTADREEPRVAADADAEVTTDSADDSLYITYGVDALCLQKWDAKNGRLSWQRLLDDGASYALPAPAGMVMNIGGELHLLDRKTGQSNKSLPSANGESRGIAATADMLLTAHLLHADQRYNIAALDPATLTERWHYSLDAKDEILEASGAALHVDKRHEAFAVLPVESEITMIHIRQNSIEVVALDPKTGSRRKERKSELPQKARPRGFEATVVGATARAAALIVDGRLALIDTSSGHILFW